MNVCTFFTFLIPGYVGSLSGPTGLSFFNHYINWLLQSASQFCT